MAKTKKHYKHGKTWDNSIIRSVYKQTNPASNPLTAPFPFLVFRALVYITLSSQNTLYLPLSFSQTQLSILPPVLLQLGHGAQTLWAASPASPPRWPLPLLSRRIRTRPSRTALSSEANTNQPQMFTLGEKGQQMRSHSIKLASLSLSLCLSLFLTFSLSLRSLQGTQRSSLDLWVWQPCSQALFASFPALSLLWVTWVSP